MIGVSGFQSGNYFRNIVIDRINLGENIPITIFNYREVGSKCLK